MSRGIGFSQAGIGEPSTFRDPVAIRPKGNLDVMMGEDGMDSEETSGRNREEESSPSPEEDEEGRAIKGQKMVHMPKKEEWDNHMRSHVPFRRWCPFCVKGKSKTGAHRRSQKSEEDQLREVPVISVDYMEPRSAEGKKQEVESLPIIVAIDRRHKWHSAIMVPEKGLNGYAVSAVA